MDSDSHGRNPERNTEPCTHSYRVTSASHVRAATSSAPSEEDLLVLDVGGPLDIDTVDRLVQAGGTVISARNPYWDRWGITIVDPDGYRLVLSHRTWG